VLEKKSLLCYVLVSMVTF